MKPFSINDILTRSPKVTRTKLTTNDHTIDHVDSRCITSLPTPPRSPETDARCDKKQDSPQTTTACLNEQGTSLKRKRDPIGQILDSLCSKAEKKATSEPSAFSPIITSTCSPQLSPLSTLAQAERRCVQTSPNGVSGTSYPHPVSIETLSKPPVALDQRKVMEAHKLAQMQQLHHHHHQHQARLRQRQLQVQPIALNAQHLPYLLHAGGHPQNIQHVHVMQERQAQLVAMEQYNASLLANNCTGGIVNHARLPGPAPPLWLSWLKAPANTTDHMMSPPVKESRIPPPPRYQCDSCKKSYSTFGGLSKHKQFHCVSHVKKEFNCKYCEKSYGSLGALKMHIRTHTLPCKCKLCGKAFSRPWLLQGHVRTHTGEKPFKCAHCGRSFADRSNLRAHLQTHSDIKKYACKNCTKTFSRMSLLLKHEEGSCMGLRR